MKYVLLFLLGVSSAFASSVTDCEGLEETNLRLFERKEIFSECFFYLSKSKGHITSACNALASGRTFSAKEELANSFISLKIASRINCDNKNKIKSLRDEVGAFKKSV